MLLNESQKYVLDSINKFGVITTKQLIKFINYKYSDIYIYKIISKLEELELIKSGKIGKEKYLYLLTEGFKLATIQMHRFKKVKLAELNHDLQVNDFLIEQYINLENNNQIDNFSVMTEREIIFEHISIADKELKKQSGNYSHLVRNIKRNIPDAIISYTVDTETTSIAFELELTQKYVTRYRQKMKDYRNEFLEGRYTTLIYMCDGKAIQEKIESVLKELQIDINIQFLQLDEVF